MMTPMNAPIIGFMAGLIAILILIIVSLVPKLFKSDTTVSTEKDNTGSIDNGKSPAVDGVEKGTITFFDKEKGHAFIDSQEIGRLIVDASDLGPYNPIIGDRVTFEIEDGGYARRAINVRREAV